MLFPEGFGITTPGQLYNLTEDIQEQHNLYEAYPEMVNELTSLFNDIKRHDGSRPK